MKNKIKTLTREKNTDQSLRKMTTVSPLRGFKDMPYGHTTCGVTLLNLSRQKKGAAHHKGREQQTRHFIPLHPYKKNCTNDLSNSEDKWKSLIQEIYWRLDA